MKIVNITEGPKGAYKGGELIWAEAGEEIDADDFAEEWFAKANSKAAKEAQD